MILVDTSVWIDHFRRADNDLMRWLERGNVLTHPFVIGELACGNIRNRHEVLGLMAQLPLAPSASDAEAMSLIESRKLSSKGIGYIDVHLLASTAFAEAKLWTHDRRLLEIATRLKLA